MAKFSLSKRGGTRRKTRVSKKTIRRNKRVSKKTIRRNKHGKRKTRHLGKRGKRKTIRRNKRGGNIVEDARKAARDAQEERVKAAANKYNPTPMPPPPPSSSPLPPPPPSEENKEEEQLIESSSEEQPINNKSHEVEYLSYLTMRYKLSDVIPFNEMDSLVLYDMNYRWGTGNENDGDQRYNTKYWDDRIDEDQRTFPHDKPNTYTADWYTDKEKFDKNDIVWDRDDCVETRSAVGCAWLVDEKEDGEKILLRFPNSDNTNEDMGFSEGDLFAEKYPEEGVIKQYMIHPVSKKVVHVQKVFLPS